MFRKIAQIAHTTGLWPVSAVLFMTVAICFALSEFEASYAADEAAKPARNNAMETGEEFLILRHQKMKKGSHETFYRLSREGVWPWFEKIGTRVVGQWQIVHPDGKDTPDYDEGYRLARYASYDHWVATRDAVPLGGNGPDYEKNNEALRKRSEYLLGSDRVFYLQGHMAPGGPYYLPATDEDFEIVDDDSAGQENAPRPVRNDIALPGQEIVTLRQWKIKKGTFEEFHRASVTGVWPYFEKIGARVVGQWKVVFPPISDEVESDEYDEVVMMTRYASYEHWQATRNAIDLGGDGGDYDALREAFKFRRSVTLSTSLDFMQGYMYHSPPKYLPSLKERYRRTSGQ
jgi:hypothetical protein